MKLEDVPAPKQRIMCSRSFGTPVLALDDLVAAISTFAVRGAEKLRKQQHLAGAVMVFIMTSPFRKRDRQYSRTVTVPLRRPTAESGLLVRAAAAGLEAIYKTGFKFAKAGVMLVDLQPETQVQRELNLVGGLAADGQPVNEHDGRARLMRALDTVNAQHGRGSIFLSSTGSPTRASTR
nr:DUF4113 domain-containing protein [Aquincola tertiaricarbonis]